MPDTVRTEAELLASCPDNDDGEIDAQQIRDIIATMFALVASAIETNALSEERHGPQETEAIFVKNWDADPDTRTGGVVHSVALQDPIAVGTAVDVFVDRNRWVRDIDYTITFTLSGVIIDFISGSYPINDESVSIVYNPGIQASVTPIEERYGPTQASPYQKIWDADRTTRSGGSVHSITLQQTPAPGSAFDVFIDRARWVRDRDYVVTLTLAGAVVTFVDGAYPAEDEDVTVSYSPGVRPNNPRVEEQHSNIGNADPDRTGGTFTSLVLAAIPTLDTPVYVYVDRMRWVENKDYTRVSDTITFISGAYLFSSETLSIVYSLGT